MTGGFPSQRVNKMSLKCLVGIKPLVEPMMISFRRTYVSMPVKQHWRECSHMYHIYISVKNYDINTIKWQQRNIKLCITGPFEGNPPWPMDSPHKGPMKRKSFSCYNAIIFFQNAQLSLLIWTHGKWQWRRCDSLQGRPGTPASSISVCAAETAHTIHVL